MVTYASLVKSKGSGSDFLNVGGHGLFIHTASLT